VFTCKHCGAEFGNKGQLLAHYRHGCGEPDAADDEIAMIRSGFAPEVPVEAKPEPETQQELIKIAMANAAADVTDDDLLIPYSVLPPETRALSAKQLVVLKVIGRPVAGGIAVEEVTFVR